MFKCVYNPSVTLGTLVILGSSKEQLLDNIENEDDQLEGSVEVFANSTPPLRMTLYTFFSRTRSVGSQTGLCDVSPMTVHLYSACLLLISEHFVRLSAICSFFPMTDGQIIYNYHRTDQVTREPLTLTHHKLDHNTASSKVLKIKCNDMFIGIATVP